MSRSGRASMKKSGSETGRKSGGGDSEKGEAWDLQANKEAVQAHKGSLIRLFAMSKNE